MGKKHSKHRRHQQEEADRLRREREEAERRFTQQMNDLRSQLAAAQREREAAVAEVSRIRSLLERERRDAERQISELRRTQADLADRVAALMRTLKAQETLYIQQLADARADNERLTVRIDQLISAQAAAREEHRLELDQLRRRADQLVAQLRAEAERTASDREELMARVKELMERNERDLQPATAAVVPASLSTTADPLTREENRRQGDIVAREIAHCDRFLRHTLASESRALTSALADLKVDPATGGAALHQLVRQERHRRAAPGFLIPLTIQQQMPPDAVGLPSPAAVALVA